MKAIISLAIILLFFSLDGITQRRCTGSANCSACTTCSGCKYCNQGGGSCGVCGGGRSYSPPSSNRPNNYTRPRTTAPYNAYKPSYSISRKTIKVVKANVRTSPSKYGYIAGTVSQGTSISIIDIIGEWYRVIIQGSIYYIHRSVF